VSGNVGSGIEARERLLGRLASAPDRLAAGARRATAIDETAGGPPPGEWTAREAPGHLVSVEVIVWQSRLDDLRRDRGTPAWAWSEPGLSTDPATVTLEGSIARFAEVRAATLARLVALDDDGWAREGIHATFGRVDVAGLMLVAADHDDDHIAALLARAGS
jgi:DinB superfamily